MRTPPIIYPSPELEQLRQWVAGARARLAEVGSQFHEREIAVDVVQLEIIAVLESLNRRREGPDYELCQLSEKKPRLLDELAAERKQLLEKESVELQQQADKLAGEIRELSGEDVSRII